MRITFEENGDACTLHQTSNSSTTAFSIPVSKPALQSAFRELLTDPEKREVMVGAVMVDRYREGLRVHAGSGRFELPFVNLFPLVLEASA
ncbi:hypothetical protein ACFMPD_13050 [Sedimentitalea sp. HM32M-2]|uniref:hypothetical protein n=1 Tax=Sedimentitalea sp. HM32M-2 TaxID=3351566 RepID=UPI00363C66F6